MKKNDLSVLLMALLAIFTLGLTSCNKEEDDVIENNISLDANSLQILTGDGASTAFITGDISSKERVETVRLVKGEETVLAVERKDFDGTNVDKIDNNTYTFSFEVNEAGTYQVIAIDRKDELISSSYVVVSAINV